MHTLQITLKQHTPLIHFQHTQDGASLRATEVKPKLDKFLCKHVFNDNFDEVKQYLVGFSEKKPNDNKEKFDKGFRALDYKLQINTPKTWEFDIERKKVKWNRDLERNEFDIDINNEIKIEQFPCFFGNMGEENKINPKVFIFFESELEIIITCFNPELLKIIKIDTQIFFEKENFGTRNSKGFGSFSINQAVNIQSKYYLDIELPNLNLRKLKTEYNYRGYTNISDEKIRIIENQRELFRQIELFYKVLRSGINMPNKYYIKSPLWAYLANKNIQWEKKTIKHKYFSTVLGSQREKHKLSPGIFPDVLNHFNTTYLKKTNINGVEVEEKIYYLIRDMLGLAVESEWKSPVYSNAKITKLHEEIKRFKSPINFKPIHIKGNIYRINIDLNIIPDEFRNEIFTIQSKGAGNLQLITPDKSIFKLTPYFNYLTSSGFNIENLISAEKNVADEYINNDVKLIVNLFNNLKVNANGATE